MSLSLAIKERALDIGFDLAGIAPISVWNDLAFSREWVKRGYAGEMGYLANSKRDDPRLVLPSAKSVVCVGLIYNADLPYSTQVADVNGKERDRPGSEDTCFHSGMRSGVSGVSGSDVKDNAISCEIHQTPGGKQHSWHSPRAWISRYAWGRDYHEVMRAKLERLRVELEALAPGVETRVYVDTGPVVERAFARFSGIGWTGKNTCLINQNKGSWFFIGVVLTNLELEPGLPAADRCGSCTRCIEACPTGALVEPYVMNASRCIAYFTIELKGAIPVEFRPAIGSNLFGCDICQDVCPWNSNGGVQNPDRAPDESVELYGIDGIPERNHLGPGHNIDTRAPKSVQLRDESASVRRFRRAATTECGEFQRIRVKPAGTESAFSLFNPTLEQLIAITESDFRRLFRDSPLKRPKYRGWLRNLCVVIGNSADPRFLSWLERVREYPDPVVREHAEWAIARLHGKD